ncbi:MAG TPA: ribosome small subunit-dependent GTPase A [Candidatus Limnocylindrales bacterium]|nr:ribosome small subunit-dependent GTPase A [Candidatus Limnocylindrales bacterium]
MTVTPAGAGPTAPFATLTGTILRARSGFYTVRTDDGRVLEAQLRGLLKKDRQPTDLAVIGDRVVVSLLGESQASIERVEPRTSKFSRRQPGPRGVWKEDMLVANVDQVLVVFACADPMPHLRMLDRFLVVAEHNQVPAVVVANKVDLVGMAQARTTFELYGEIGYPLHFLSAREGIGVEELADRLSGRTSVVTGPSGVGKSTLLNAIQPGLRIETGDVSEFLHKGRHTTTSAELHALTAPGNGYVADTPGLREVGLWQIPPNELAWCFPEFEPFLGQCAFNDCRHLEEPRCAVLAAVEAGGVSAARHDSYRRLSLNED